MCCAVLILMLLCVAMSLFSFKNIHLFIFYLATFAGTLQQQKPKAQKGFRSQDFLSSHSQNMHFRFVAINIFNFFVLSFCPSLSSHLLSRYRVNFRPAAQPDLRPRPSAALWPEIAMGAAWTIFVVSDIWPSPCPSHHPGSGFRR